MPTLQDIEHFKEILNSLGSEPEILAARSEEIEEIPVPEQGLAADLSELLEPSAEAEGEISTAADLDEFPLAEGEEEAPPEGFDEFALPEDEAAGPGAAEAAGETEGESPDFDFASLFEGEEAVPEGEAEEEPLAEPALPGEELAEEEALAEPALPGEEALPGEFPPDERPPEEELPEMELPGEEPGEEPGEDFALPEDFEVAGEAAEPEGGEIGEEAAGGEAALPAEEAVEEEEVGAEEVGEEAGLPAEEAFGAEMPGIEAAEEQAEEAEIPEAIEGLELPDEFGEEMPSFDEEAAPAAAAEEEIELPDFELEEGAGAGPAAEEEEVEEGAGAGAAAEEEEAEELIFEAEEGGEADFQIDEFALPDFGEEFEIEEEEKLPEAEAEVMPAQAEGAEQEIEEAEEEFELSEEDFAQVQKALILIPRNLKIAIEELIAEKKLSGDKLRTLIGYLVEGAAPKTIAAYVSRLVDKKIFLPRAFEKKTGLAFELERKTFAYAFRENIIPVLRVFVLSLILVSLLGYAGYNFIYRPLYAGRLYRQGYEQIVEKNYTDANSIFNKAVGVRQVKGWFGKYAEGFRDHNQFRLAEEKYEQLLERYENDRQGLLDYADLATNYLKDYPKADEKLKLLLEEDFRDYDGLLASGDNHLEWAKQESSHFEDARFAYASLLESYGDKKEVMFRMLKYFIRTDQLEEVKKLKMVLESDEKLKVDPEIYAELGGYLLDQHEYDEVTDTLFKAMEVKADIPDIHYNLARYFNHVGDTSEEYEALKNSIKLLKDKNNPDKDVVMLIDSHNRMGKYYWNRKEYLKAEEHYNLALKDVETFQKHNILGKREEFGEVHYNLGDIYYYIEGNLDTSFSRYKKAKENYYKNPELDYKLGFINYARQRYGQALLDFSKVAETTGNNPNALYSLANTLFERKDYFAAQGYYLHLLDMLERTKDNIPYLRIEENPEHRALLENIMKVYNNLGVTLGKLGLQLSDNKKQSQALVNLTFSSEYYDLLSRDPESMVRAETRNLAYLNQRGMIYPETGFQPQIYLRIPKDTGAQNF